MQTKHLFPNLKEGEGYGEKYTFDADFGARGSFYFSLTISNLGLGDHKMEAKGRLTIDNEKFTWRKELSDDEWSFKKDPFQIKAGPASLSGEPEKLVMTAKGGKNELEFTFTPIANAWRPQNGQIQYGKDRKASDFTIFPLMKVEGRYKMGGDWKTLEPGIGYGSHTWSELAVYEQNRWNLSFRGIEGQQTFYMREIGATSTYGKERIAYLIITEGDKLLVESFDYNMKPTEVFTDAKHENKYQVPESFQVIGVDSDNKNIKFRGAITKKKLRQRKNLLSGMNAAVKMVAKRYSKPMLYEYDSDYLLQVKGPGMDKTFKGVGRYEVYHWNQ
ncbi:hypothetical protein KKF91_13340 [Myxococcota bacterium]|nr:hypothetical protein [Myxococcota bacterium]